MSNAMRLIEEMGRREYAGVAELSRALSLSKPSVDRLLSTLINSGFVEQDADTKKYRLGMKLVAIADSIRPRTSLIDIAKPHLAVLARRFAETVNLGTLVGGSVIYADTIPSQRPFRIELRAGTMLPAHNTGVGKAILAFRPNWEVERYIEENEFERLTPRSTDSGDELRKRLSETRAKGFAVDDGEILEEACCASAPVFDAEGLAIAAISITAPRSTFYRIYDDAVAAILHAAARTSADNIVASGQGRSR
ncbi:IclR family transcriptional regulator [Mesorhizobium sp. CAU 1732]|uniref:IclR family transcriptional regulator n=1 Tax=Mesorhizobium sp. CAU 1732 TaxID=3140358 RepID=UPI0032614897